MWIYSIINRLPSISKLWKAKFFILCDKNTSSEAAGEIWNWSLLRFFFLVFVLFCIYAPVCLFVDLFIDMFVLSVVCSAVPPYVPNLKSAEDTSHFEEFEPDSPELLIDSIEKYGGPKAPGGFSGKDLPFVGFTFFKPLALPPGSPRKWVHFLSFAAFGLEMCIVSKCIPGNFFGTELSHIWRVRVSFLLTRVHPRKPNRISWWRRHLYDWFIDLASRSFLSNRASLSSIHLFSVTLLCSSLQDLPCHISTHSPIFSSMHLSSLTLLCSRLQILPFHPSIYSASHCCVLAYRTCLATYPPIHPSFHPCTYPASRCCVLACRSCLSIHPPIHPSFHPCTYPASRCCVLACRSLLATSPAAVASSTSIQRRLTMKTQELKNALQSCDGLKDERSAMQNMLDDLKAALEHKDKCLTNAEIERDLLEKEKVLYDTQIKVRQLRPAECFCTESSRNLHVAIAGTTVGESTDLSLERSFASWSPTGRVETEHVFSVIGRDLCIYLFFFNIKLVIHSFIFLFVQSSLAFYRSYLGFGFVFLLNLRVVPLCCRTCSGGWTPRERSGRSRTPPRWSF